MNLDTSSCSLKEIAQLFEVDITTVNTRVRAGRWPKKAHGVYDLKDILRAEAIYLAGTEQNARNSLYRVQAEKFELDNAQKRGELLRADQVVTAMSEIVMVLISGLESLGGRLSGELAGIADAGIIRTRITDETRELRAEMLATLERRVQSWVSGSDLEGLGGAEGAEVEEPESMGEGESNTPARKRRARKVSTRKSAVDNRDH